MFVMFEWIQCLRSIMLREIHMAQPSVEHEAQNNLIINSTKKTTREIKQ